MNEATTLTQIILVAEPVYFISITLIKLSLLFMYHRIFPIQNMRTGATILGAISIAWLVALTSGIHTMYTPQETLAAMDRRTMHRPSGYIPCGIDPEYPYGYGYLGSSHAACLEIADESRAEDFSECYFLIGEFCGFCSVYWFTVYFHYDSNDEPYTPAQPAARNVVQA